MREAADDPSPAERERTGPGFAFAGRGGEGGTFETKDRYEAKAEARLTPRARKLRREQTPAERLLCGRLRGGRLDGHRFRRQDPIGPYIADFFCEAAKLVVEVDGSQHADQMTYDEKRTQFLEGRGYRVLRFWNGEVTGGLDDVVGAIAAAALPSPSLPAKGQAGPSLSRSAGERF